MDKIITTIPQPMVKYWAHQPADSNHPVTALFLLLLINILSVF